MNLQLNPNQLLALYELVVHTTSTSSDSKKKSTFIELKEKLHDVISNSLNQANDEKNKEKLSAWLGKEEQKINQLNDELSKLRQTRIDRSKEPDDGLYFPPEKK